MMAQIKVVLSGALVDGMDIKFKAPCDCTEVDGLIVEYPMEGDTTGSQEFTFKDAHGVDLVGIGNLFSKGAYVKVIVDTANGFAYLQNADNNSYLHSAVLGTYIHSSSGLVGSGVNGKFKSTKTGIVSFIQVNGVNHSVRCGEDTSIELVEGCWYTFILDGATINFNTGGTGAGLSFKVVAAATQPVSPTENLIWVVTETPMANWVISPTEPEVDQIGTIWIRTNLTGDVTLNAIKRNGIILYPVGVKQYIGSQWVSLDAHIYQNGMWIQFALAWDGYYFQDGEQYEEFTGGWSSDGYNSTGTVTVANILEVLSPNASKPARVGTVNPIDLTNVNTLYYDSTTGKNGKAYPGYLMVTEAKGVGNTAAQATISNSGTGSIDVSELEGSYYIWLHALGGASGSGYTSVRAIWKDETVMPSASEFAMLNLDGDPSDDTVSVLADDEDYGVNNASVNNVPEGEPYDFTVL